MAVRAVSTPQVGISDHGVTLPAAVLALALVPVALDLLSVIQPALSEILLTASLVAAGAAAAVMLLMWMRFPRAGWLAAATLAAGASLVLRLSGTEGAPLLALLSVLALGIGGGFASSEFSLPDA
ncbi:MAG: hypothetical protein JO057_19370 [Chloroflexi bacterium]|nr:hypothetical protein [Chloroflexota bacterium]